MRFLRYMLAPLLTLVALLVFVPAALANGPGFGLQDFEISTTEKPTAEQEAKHELGAPDTRAGSHPYELTVTFMVNEPPFNQKLDGYFSEGGGLKDAQLLLPPGFVGNPNATPTCPYVQFAANECPNDTAIGVATTGIGAEEEEQGSEKVEEKQEVEYYNDPVYNVEPQGGVPDLLGWRPLGAHQILSDASVRTGSDYGITETVHNITQSVVVVSTTVKIWGVPADPSHDRFRGTTCLTGSFARFELEASGIPIPPISQEESKCPDPEREAPGSVPVEPFLTNPTSCGAPRTATLSVDDWEDPGNFTTGENIVSKTATLPPLTGCEKLDFSPSLSVQPDGSAGSTPTGLNVDVHVNQESTKNPEGLGEADVKDTTVALPAGVQISPSAADGLQACSNAEIGFTGEFKELDPITEPGVKTPQFTPYLPGSIAAAQAGDSEPLRPGVNFCPDASKIATVKIKTPLLEGELEGAVYLAAPQNFTGLPENPLSSLVAMYLVAEEPNTGVLVKLPGKVALNESTGQITATFENTPQLPFSDLKLEFYGTDRAPLATPAQCGTYSTEASFAPWSGEPGVSPPASFQITSGPDGSSCTYPGQALPFSPALASGATNNNAGSFSDLTTTLSREDGQQQIQQVTLHYPPGLSGLLSGVELCPEAQANAGTCGPNSQVGETIVSVGLGNDPFSVTGGKVYLTGPYEGAPFGLSIVNPAKAGPFDLQEGHPVVVRAKIEVNPITAALTVTTNTAAQGYAIPSMIEGIPLQIKHVNVNITRPGFTFNPTNCDPTGVTGTVASAEGASSPVSIPFQVTNCASLKFQPGFSVTSQGRTSKADGASLTAKVSYPSVPQGTEANIASVKVELPEQLPSRLTTLQKACTAAQFDANPAGCPSPSVIGHAIVRTPLLPVPLEGPAYFVSNGGEAFPNLIIVLQGYGVTIDLVGDTFISKAGITSTTFKTVPDQPFSSFELTLPEGRYSALAANGNLCALTRTATVKKKVTVKVKGRKRTVTRNVEETKPAALVMPNEFVAQNGAVVRQDTNISVIGCAKSKPAKNAEKKRKKAAKKSGKK